MGKPTPRPSQEGKIAAQPAPQGNAGVKFPSWEGRGVGSHNKETPPKKRPLIEVVTRLFRAKTPSTPPRPAPNFGEGPGVGSTWTEPTTGMEFVWIPAGRFLMGSPASEAGRREDEGPQHEVVFKEGFWMGKYPVTQDEWMIMRNNPSRFKGERHPMKCVSWDECQEFLKKLNATHPPLPLPREEQRGIPLSGGNGVGSPLLGGSGGGLLFRLPSEAEWEYACRAGTQTAYSFGDDPARFGKYAWYSKNSGKEKHPVSQMKPNAFGLWDMHGNLSEWCADTWHNNYDGAPTDGSAWGSLGDKKGKVIRGGYSKFDRIFCRSACRGWGRPDVSSYLVGVRVVAVPLRTL